MPITLAEFASAKGLLGTRVGVLTFLSEHRDMAYTCWELVGEIGLKKGLSFTEDVVNAFTVLRALNDLEHEHRVVGGFWKDGQVYYSIK